MKKAIKEINKVENKEIKNRMPIFLLAGILLICVALIIFYYIALRYSPINTIMYEGYAVEAKTLTKNLKSENFENVEQSLELLKVEEQETIYQKMSNYYVGGDEKKNIDLNYPIYINEKAAILNLSEDTKIITKNYEKIEGYANFMLAEGKLYNAHDLSKADNNEYILVETKEGTYVAVKEIEIETAIGEYTIPVNSIIYFTEGYITYYQIEEDKLIYNNILEIDGSSKITIETMEEISYEEFLKKIGITEEQIAINQDEEPEEGQEQGEGEGTEQNPSQEEPTEAEYIKPTITAENFEARVYTAQTNIDIEDPQGRITQAIFVIKRGNRTYQRRQILGEGSLELTGLTPETEFEIEGTYRYYNENQIEVEETFFIETIITKTIEELGSIVLEHEAGEIYSNKVEIKNLAIQNEITEEVIKRITKKEIKKNRVQYKLSNAQVSKLKSGEAITYQTSESVKSDKNITYTIHIYDNQGNELKVENEKGKTRTAKEVPSVRVQMKTQEVNITEMTIKLENKDNAKIENYYYVILNNGNEIIKENLEENTKEISRTDLDPNGYYTICFYADYDIEDGKGIRRNEKIGEYTFTTMPLASLGNIYWQTEITELGTNRVKMSILLDEIRTDKRLIQMINYVELIITDKEGNQVAKYELNKETIKSAETIEQEIIGLTSNTEYSYEINTKIKQGSIEEQVGKEQTNNKFTTKKKPAKVLIRNQFITGEMIDYDVKIQDEDRAILTNNVRIEMRDSKNRIIVVETIGTNGEYERKQYNKLEENQTYTITYYAEQYNEGNDNTTYESNHIIYTQEFITEMGISGTLKLHSVSKQGTGKNLINVASEVNWVSNSLFNASLNSYGKEYNKETRILTITGNNKYVYDLREYAGETITLSFSAMQEGTANAGIQNNKANTNRTKIENLSTTEWKDYEYTLMLDESGYLGFYITSGTIHLKNIQVELRR